MRNKIISALCLVTFCLLNPAKGDVTIGSTDDFIKFANDVNSGAATYSGSTVLLASDIDFSTTTSTFNPIGNTTTSYFQGVFDGQGHIISNLALKLSLEYTGLFGYAEGVTIRNVVLDSSCTITYAGSSSSSGMFPSGGTSTTTTPVYGGIIGGCKDCLIENCVNMADISSSMYSMSSGVHMGGIVGDLSSESTTSVVKNCANYGDLSQTMWSTTVYQGGIVGYCTGTSGCDIQNSLNYGTLYFSAAQTSFTTRHISSTPSLSSQQHHHKDRRYTTSATVVVGGMLGYTDVGCAIKNCMSAGLINQSSTYSTFSSVTAGTALGSVDTTSGSTVTIDGCYYTGGVSVSSVCGESTVTATSSEMVSEDESTGVEKLNGGCTTCGWNKWIHNGNGATVSFRVDGRSSGVDYTSKFVLAPTFAVTSNAFAGWFTKSDYTEEFTGYSVSSDTTLYGRYGIMVSFYVATEDGRVLAEVPAVSVVYGGTYGVLPVPDLKDYDFAGWSLNKGECNDDDLIKTSTAVTTISDHTLYACLILKPTTVSSSSSLLLSSSSSILSSSSSSSISLSSSSSSMISSSSSITLSSSSSSSSILSSSSSFSSISSLSNDDSSKFTSKYVEVIFSSSTITMKKAEEIISNFTNDRFTVVSIESVDESGDANVKVIVLFTSESEATTFVRSVESYIREQNTYIRSVKQVTYSEGDFASSVVVFKMAMMMLLSFVFAPNN